jgi:hypothetical protein
MSTFELFILAHFVQTLINILVFDFVYIFALFLA